MKTYQLVQQGEHRYTIDVQEVIEEEKSITLFVLKYSKCESWVSPDKVLLVARDTGNDISLSKHSEGSMKLSQLKYDVADELSLLLRFIMLYQTGDINDEFSYTIMKQVDNIKL